MEYDKYISREAAEIQPSGIRKFFDIVAEMKGAISLGVGEPDFLTPWNARNSAINAIKSGYTQYTSNRGLLKLRERISEYLRLKNGLDYDPNNEIIVTVGASEAIDLSLRALVNTGDEILIPEPSYVSYAPIVRLCKGVPIAVPCSVRDSFMVTPDALKSVISDRTKAIIMPYPNNPTGAIMTGEALKTIAEVIIHNDLLVISDEIYSELTYGGKHVSIASLDGMRERTILINGFSKSFAMTGWRVGYLAAPHQLADIMFKIHQYAIMCAPTISQYAALSALEDGLNDGFSSIKEMTEQYDMRRRYCVKTLNDMGLECYEPRGAFYVFPRVSDLNMDGTQFADRLLKEKKIAVIPGEAFGSSGKDFVRISYAYSIKSLMAAMERIREFIAELKVNN